VGELWWGKDVRKCLNPGEIVKRFCLYLFMLQLRSRSTYSALLQSRYHVLSYTSNSCLFLSLFDSVSFHAISILRYESPPVIWLTSDSLGEQTWLISLAMSSVTHVSDSQYDSSCLWLNFVSSYDSHVLGLVSIKDLVFCWYSEGHAFLNRPTSLATSENILATLVLLFSSSHYYFGISNSRNSIFTNSLPFDLETSGRISNSFLVLLIRSRVL